MTVGTRLGRTPRIALAGAAVYATALVAAGFLVPVYETADGSSSGGSAHGSATLVAVNGPGVAVALTVPLLATLLVTGALLLPGRGALPVAWALTGLVAVFTLAGLLSIGLFVLPVTAALVLACATTRPVPPRPDPAATASG